MKVRVFTLRLDPSTGRFDDTEVTAWLNGREVLSVTEHFFVHELTPTLVLILTLRDSAQPTPSSEPAPNKKPDPVAELSDLERPFYEALRSWRNGRAKRDGRPVYIYLTNRQMADLARIRPANLADLEQVNGIGAAKAAQFGQEILALFVAASPEAQSGT